MANPSSVFISMCWPSGLVAKGGIYVGRKFVAGCNSLTGPMKRSYTVKVKQT